MKPQEAVDKTPYVAVYGTLRQGFGNHRLLKHGCAELMGRFRVKLPFYMESLGGFPGLIPSGDRHNITVEVYQVDKETMNSLDILEGYPRFYDKKRVQVEDYDAWIYFLPEPLGRTVVQSGDWLDYSHQRGSGGYDE